MDVILGQLQPPRRRLQGVRIHETRADESVACRCGTRIQAGGTVIRVENLPPGTTTLFWGQDFHSVRCLRAFCLESLETLDALDTPESRGVVTDLHEFYLAVAETFALILST